MTNWSDNANIDTRPIKYWYSFTISCRCISWLDPKPILWGSIHSGIWDKHHVVPRSHSDSVWLASSHSKVLMLRQYNSHIITLVSKRIYFIPFEMPLTSTSLCDCVMRYRLHSTRAHDFVHIQYITGKCSMATTLVQEPDSCVFAAVVHILGTYSSVLYILH